MTSRAAYFCTTPTVFPSSHCSSSSCSPSPHVAAHASQAERMRNTSTRRRWRDLPTGIDRRSLDEPRAPVRRAANLSGVTRVCPPCRPSFCLYSTAADGEGDFSEQKKFDFTAIFTPRVWARFEMCTFKGSGTKKNCKRTPLSNLKRL